MKKCRVCKEKFEPRFSTTEVVCSMKCAIAFARTDQGKDHHAKARRKEAADAKRKFLDNDKAHWREKAQKEFNAFIRNRDKHMPCISCGENRPNIQYAAGHYRTVGACPELRFEELNCHRQCNSNCNQHRSGNIGEYRIGLIDRIGLDKVEWLEGPHAPKKYTVDDYKEIYKDYRDRNKVH